MKLFKKTISLFLIVGMVLSFSFVSYAEGIDLSGYSDDEIIALNEKVQQEIINRKINATADVINGTYKGGTDLPVGRYDLFLIERDLFSMVTVTPAALVGTEIESDDDYSFFEYFGDSDVGKQWSITIEEGDVLEVSNCKISLTISSGLIFK